MPPAPRTARAGSTNLVAVSARSAARLPATARVRRRIICSRVRPDQQEGEQHQRRIEIGVFGVIERLDDRHAEREQHADRDRHVHVEAARPDGANRRVKERPARIGRRRQCDQRRQPMKEVALLRRDVGDIARPHRDREQHDVHRREGGDAEAAQQRLRLAPLARRRICRNRTDRRGSPAAESRSMKPAGSTLPSRHSTATRRSVRFTRARMMSGIAARPFSIVRMQPPQWIPSTASSMRAIPPSRWWTKWERSRALACIGSCVIR